MSRLTRRSLLEAFGASVGLAACGTPIERATVETGGAGAVDRLLADTVTIDMHSHLGLFGGRSAVFEPVAVPMREGRMAVACLAAVADGPLNRVVGGRIVSIRPPAPGELYRHTTNIFQRVRSLMREQGLGLVTSVAEMDATRSVGPGVIVASEGSDFLEGRLDRLDEAYEVHGLRHLQLTHYRANELGDIQTEAPIRGGLTGFGADVIRACNRRGIVVDVAHGTYELVKQAAAVTSKPLVLSHSSLANPPGSRSRRISPDHARAIAATGGVVGLWPVQSIFGSLSGYAEGFARLADLVGLDHVGLGTDMRGLVGPSLLDDYRQLPALAERLLAVGFDEAGAGQVLGGNYRRVFAATMVAA